MQRYSAPRYQAVLGIGNVGVDDDFALGGDSIKCAMVAEKCGVYRISTANIFTEPNLRA